MFMAQFDPTAPKFGYDFFWDTLNFKNRSYQHHKQMTREKLQFIDCNAYLSASGCVRLMNVQGNRVRRNEHWKMLIYIHCQVWGVKRLQNHNIKSAFHLFSVLGGEQRHIRRKWWRDGGTKSKSVKTVVFFVEIRIHRWLQYFQTYFTTWKTHIMIF